jgi:hypothetical protein
MESGGLVPVNAQPADEFERRLGEALQDSVDQRECLPGFLQIACLLVQPFLAALDCGGVFHALLLVSILQEQQEVVNEGHKMGLPLLGGGRGRPGFFLLQLGLGFVKHLLDFPARFVEQRQQPRFQRPFPDHRVMRGVFQIMTIPDIEIKRGEGFKGGQRREPERIHPLPQQPGTFRHHRQPPRAGQGFKVRPHLKFSAPKQLEGLQKIPPAAHGG